VRITVQQLLTSSVIKNYAMARDFRVAMNQICRAAVERDDLLTESAARVVDWLRGNLKSVRTLRSAMIFERINRYNARSMFASLGQWVRRSRSAGLLIVVDVSRFASRRPIAGPDGTEIRPPSQAAVMDTYEMMRQCIDGTDEMYGVAICFLTGPEFVQDDKRGMRAYSALEQRLTDDVRDRRRSNPHAPERACTRHCRRKRFNEQHQLATPWPQSSGLPPALAQASACLCRPAFDPGRGTTSTASSTYPWPAPEAHCMILPAISAVAETVLLRAPLRTNGEHPRTLDLRTRLLGVFQPPLEASLSRSGPLGWPADLMNFQLTGIRLLLDRDRLLQADEMGLGKDDPGHRRYPVAGAPRPNFELS
jgi:hypothetical protein